MNHVKKPDWLKINIGANARYTETKHIVDSHKLHTICSTFSPAFSHIGATPTAADCVQAVGINYSFGFGVSFVGTDINFQPFRLTYSVSHYKLFKKKLVNRVYKC